MPPPDDDGILEVLKRYNQSDHEAVTVAREVASSVLLVSVVGLLLFAASGVWPPMVAVKSPSMEPHMSRGDLIFVVEEHRFAPKHAIPGTGVVTYEIAAKRESHRNFGMFGDVIVFDSNGDGGIPIIHRAHFWVEKGENWYKTGNSTYIQGGSCEAIANCPAPHAGFITKGDSNGEYDQTSGISEPVRPSWIRGRAEVRIPLLGHVRLALERE